MADAALERVRLGQEKIEILNEDHKNQGEISSLDINTKKNTPVGLLEKHVEEEGQDDYFNVLERDLSGETSVVNQLNGTSQNNLKEKNDQKIVISKLKKEGDLNREKVKNEENYNNNNNDDDDDDDSEFDYETFQHKKKVSKDKDLKGREVEEIENEGLFKRRRYEDEDEAEKRKNSNEDVNYNNLNNNNNEYVNYNNLNNNNTDEVSHARPIKTKQELALERQKAVAEKKEKEKLETQKKKEKEREEFQQWRNKILARMGKG
jgi:hypothetical protein